MAFSDQDKPRRKETHTRVILLLTRGQLVLHTLPALGGLCVPSLLDGPPHTFHAYMQRWHTPWLEQCVRKADARSWHIVSRVSVGVSQAVTDIDMLTCRHTRTAHNMSSHTHCTQHVVTHCPQHVTHTRCTRLSWAGGAGQRLRLRSSACSQT